VKMKVEYLEEPKLQFGAFFEYEDTKTGLAEFGPFGKNIPGLHPSEIKLGFIGTRETIEDAQDWIRTCGHYIESENIKVFGKSPAGNQGFWKDLLPENPVLRRMYKILNRDFVGFNKDHPFECALQMNQRWERSIEPRELDPVLELPEKEQRILRLVSLIEERLASLVGNTPKPDIVIIALTHEMETRAESVRVSGGYYLNLRRAIKAAAMRQKDPVPVQLVRRRTIEGKGDIQEVATRAWNFCTALYYKAEGIPWRPMTLHPDTCYVGISFYIAQKKDRTLTIRSSVAQAFDYLGQGLILRGDPFEWNSYALGRTPHLTKEAAKKLILRVLKEYEGLNRRPPTRVVIHKTSEFWGEDRKEHNERDGFYEGIDEFHPNREIDLVTLRQAGVRLFREGQYPPLRGTYFVLEDREHFLYTMGYIPYLQTYPKPYVPEPWHLVQHIGGSSPKDILREVLALTKMNVNNCAFADGAPITISFSRKVGEIMKHAKDDGKIQSSYRFYM
jgi:hypothetical protein